LVTALDPLDKSLAACITLFMGLFSLFAADQTQPPKMKTINYRDGVVEFRIPASWKEEYADADGGIFFDDRPDSGTLRLKLITVTTPSEINRGSAIELLKALRQVQGQAVALPSGNAWAKFTESSVDRGQKIKTFYWFVSNPVPPRHARLATFSYTILEAQEHAPKVAQELQILDQEIRTAEFSKEIGSFS
jgi:hypothetical protein